MAFPLVGVGSGGGQAEVPFPGVGGQSSGQETPQAGLQLLGDGGAAAAPTELMTPEDMAHPHWDPVLGGFSAEQGGDRAFSADLRKGKR